MTHSFTLRSVYTRTTLELIGAIPRGLEDYEDARFVAALTGGGVTATVTLGDIHFEHWSALFRDLADHWRGWEGEKSHESMEGNLRIGCTHDGLGHITARVILRGDIFGSDWRAEDSIFLEAGQLDRIAAEAGVYFG